MYKEKGVPIINYPKSLNAIFDKLLALHIKPIIVGGFIRNALLQIDSKDIDIELYGISSFKKLEAILEEFGKVNSVGKSFGICKLHAFALELDFSFPRKDSKVSRGHKGFLVEVDTNLDFKTASSRRDFTINSMGYDVQNRKLLDPFHGEKDLTMRILRAVDSEKFQEDPLRVFRAVQLSARFDLTLDDKLLAISKLMVKKGLIRELAKERIFEEIKKLLLQSKKVSSGIKLLEKLNLFTPYKIDSKSLDALDRAISFEYKDNKQKLVIMLAIWSHSFPLDLSEKFVKSLSNDKNLYNNILTLLKNRTEISLENFTDFDLYMLARKVKIENLLLLLKALNNSKRALLKIEEIEKRAKELNILSTPAPALLGGKDLLALGLKPSKTFSIILEKLYLAQIKGVFQTKEEALLYLEKLDSLHL